MARIRVVAQTSGTGLQMDMEIVARLLEQAGHSVERCMVRPQGSVGRKLFKLLDRAKRLVPSAKGRKFLVRLELGMLGLGLRRQVDANIFLENLFPRLLASAPRNMLIPNQEWFRSEQAHYLAAIDLVLCKTRDAEQVFSALGCKTAFTSFTSEDKYWPGASKDHSRVIHFAGNGHTKGTRAVVGVWGRHPEWPQLWITQRKNNRQPLPGANMQYFTDFLSEEELARLQNEVPIYLGPSEAEGFGHALVEAMSAEAIVITTDGAPMNEVVRPGRGFLVPFREKRPRRLGMAYAVDENALENVIGEVLALPAEEKAEIGRRAREWYLENDRYFRHAFVEAVNQCLQGETIASLASSVQRSQ